MAMTRHEKIGFRKELTSNGGMTLDEVAKEMGISKQAVSQIEMKALAKLKRILEARGYTFENLVGAS